MSFDEAGINWFQANCRGMRTNDFFDVEEKRQTQKVQNELMEVIRPTCFSCPIWANCLKWAYANEEYGVWGGFTSSERNSMAGRGPSTIRIRALKMAEGFGVTENQIKGLMP